MLPLSIRTLFSSRGTNLSEGQVMLILASAVSTPVTLLAAEKEPTFNFLFEYNDNSLERSERHTPVDGLYSTLTTSATLSLLSKNTVMLCQISSR